MTTELHLSIDRSASVPRQIADQLRVMIAAGNLKRGVRLPPTRTLATELGVGRRSVVDAFEQLIGEGWLRSTHGSGTWVADIRPIPRAADDNPELYPEPATPRFDLYSGEVDISEKFQDAWRSAARRVPLDGVLAPDVGEHRLRAAITHRLSAVRGLTAHPGEVLITAGTTESMLLIALGLELNRGLGIGMEDPGYPRTTDVLRTIGAKLRPIPITSDGIDTAALRAAAPELAAVVVSPSHQYPMGHRMPIASRQEIIAIGKQSQVTIIEDDYDSEFRYGAPPLPPLATLDAEVIYLGTLSKLLAPSIRLSYIVARGARLDALKRIRTALGPTVAKPIQLIVADLLESGELDAHASRQRRRYARRRHDLANRFDDTPGVVRISGLDAGLHVTLELDERLDAPAIQRQLKSQGIAVGTLHDCHLDPTTARQGLIVIYSGHELDDLATCATVIQDVISSAQLTERADLRSPPSTTQRPPPNHVYRAISSPSRNESQQDTPEQGFDGGGNWAATS
ncbi:MAG: PLP-dependent aminotransferase family protein [Acidimicrobiales bacterium]|nr:PLP-dependent aminotransferase family protein [Acidimicrobiales bacterium]MYG86922.1 PLP-dependent aminotransferase family protein [Acidimicrobiales bacterium]MYI29491.1 PLP-dependent aminotransferase family protein [Acidimicrobiales bacterium]